MVDENSARLSVKEQASYSLSFAAGSNTYYSYAYDTDTATYVTAFYATTYDWTTSHENYRSAETETEYVYVYETSLTISGTLTHKATGEALTFSDKVTTVAYFRSAEKNLEPVYSRQDIVSTSPANLTSSSLTASYVTYDRVCETWYSKDATQATTKTTVRDGDTDGAGERETTACDLKANGYSVFDTNMRQIALRSLSYSSYTYNEYVPLNGAIAQFGTSVGGATALEQTEDAGIIAALDGADGYIFVNEKNEDGKTVYRVNGITDTASGNLSGSAPTYYYVNVTNRQVNAGRAVMAKMVCPIYFACGTLTYSLTDLQTVAIGTVVSD